MSEDAIRSPLSRTVRLEALGERARGDIEVTEAETAAIAPLLDLAALDGLAFSYRLRPGAGRRVHLSGRLKARVTQTCVVTLEPVEVDLDVPVEAEFWPAETIAELERSAEDQAGLADWPEPILDGAIDLGPLIYETLATSLDPYPKKDGASFEWSHDAAGQGEGADSGPFAALKQFKGR
jgi:uncharacterized metal-binding protein YceD (DUF177 family)